jgi:hypothetical protein
MLAGYREALPLDQGYSKTSIPTGHLQVSNKEKTTHEGQDGDQGNQADPRRPAAGGTQAAGAGMIGAVNILAVSANGLGQALTSIASGRFVIFGDLRPPPARPGATSAQRLGADPIRPQISLSNGGFTAGTINGAVRGTK